MHFRNKKRSDLRGYSLPSEGENERRLLNSVDSPRNYSVESFQKSPSSKKAWVFVGAELKATDHFCLSAAAKKRRSHGLLFTLDLC